MFRLEYSIETPTFGPPLRESTKEAPGVR
uniref:Uncharacterized protein n=1 Tax=Arundo donax TaxID=35708 RepID=A0A0A9FA02_ARUDO